MAPTTRTLLVLALLAAATLCATAERRERRGRAPRHGDAVVPAAHPHHGSASQAGPSQVCLLDLHLRNCSMSLGGAVLKPLKLKIRPANLVRMIGTVPLALPGACPADRAGLAAALPSARVLALPGTGIRMGTLQAKVLWANVSIANLAAPAQSTGPVGADGSFPLSINTTSGATIVTTNRNQETVSMVGTVLNGSGCYLAAGAAGVEHDVEIMCPAGAFGSTVDYDGGKAVIEINVFGHIEAVGSLAAARQVDAASVGMA